MGAPHRGSPDSEVGRESQAIAGTSVGAGLCKAADPRDAEGPQWNALWRDVCGVGDDPAVFPHKSQWEWTQGIHGLVRLGQITEQATALGVGAGHEPPIYWLANHIGHVVATDLYTGSYAYEDGRPASDDPAMLTNPEKFGPYPYRRERLSVGIMDGRSLAFPDETFDIVFSFSSIEHVGGHDESTKMAREMARVAKADGIVVISTEMIVQAPWLRRLAAFPVNRTYFWPDQIQPVLLAPAGLHLVGSMNTRVRQDDIAAAPVVGRPTGARTYCMRVGRLGKTTFTPVMLFAQKG